MDGKDFDQLAKRLGGLASRRQTLGGLVGAALGVAGLSGADAAKKGRGDRFTAADVKKGKGIGKSQCGATGCIACSDGSVPDPTTDPVCPAGTVQVCTPGTTEGACGSGGGGTFCTACGAGEVCAPNTEGNGGTCVEPVPGCNATGLGATQCTAATGGNAVCASAEGGTFCGSRDVAGVDADPCLPGCGTGSRCVQDGGTFGFTCVSGTCQAQCPNGCCAGQNDPINPVGSCQPGNDITACGSAGGTCVSCLAVCGLNGSCVNGVCSCLTPPPPPPPPPTPCAGCLNETTGECQLFTGGDGNEQGNLACGKNGNTCRQCPGDRPRCVAHKKVQGGGRCVRRRNNN